MLRTLLLLGLALALPARSGPAVAGEFAPGNNGSTLARAFALPNLGDGAVLARARSETTWTYDVANEYVAEGACAVECILLDGETSRLRLTHRRGLGDGWDMSFEVPLLDRGGGFLDGWIQDWHDFFGLPNGGRELAPDGRYRFQYTRQNVVLLDETGGGTGVGDSTITLGRRLGQRSALRGMAKLPTGDDDSFEGGVAGYALWLEHGAALAPRVDSFIALGVSYSERGPALAQMQRREVVFGGVGLAIPVTNTVRLALQVQGHGRLFDGSGMTPLERPGMPLSVGLQFRTSARGSFEIGFQEDPSVNGSPDFAAYLTLRSTAFSPPR